MRSIVSWVRLAALTVAAPAIPLSCGTSNSDAEAVNLGTVGDGGGGVFGSRDAMRVSECTGLQCKAKTDDCAGKGKPPTTVSGLVYDPAGKLALYNVYVYVPNTTPDPITPGGPTCTQCAAPASGSPVTGALTDATGTFELAQRPGDPWGVPSGEDVPLVLQSGKWRRQVVVPHIEACTANKLPDPKTPSEKLRLPAKTSEGDMPLIAFTSGCDPAECFLHDIGIDDSEFVPPASTTGHVHFYTGNRGATIEGGNTIADTYKWWTSAANLKRYDIVFNACECAAYPRSPDPRAYNAMNEYLSSGGRVFATHLYYNWFAPPTGPAELGDFVNWNYANFGNYATTPYQNNFIDTSFPKGRAFADWLQNNGTTTTHGEVDFGATLYNDMDTLPATSKATRWIYNADKASDAKSHAQYVSLDTPVNQPTEKQCGRAVLSDVHLSASNIDAAYLDRYKYPAECVGAPGNAVNHERALEFLFFDLSSCVQDISKAPPPPPIK